MDTQDLEAKERLRCLPKGWVGEDQCTGCGTTTLVTTTADPYGSEGGYEYSPRFCLACVNAARARLDPSHVDVLKRMLARCKELRADSLRLPSGSYSEDTPPSDEEITALAWVVETLERG